MNRIYKFLFLIFLLWGLYTFKKYTSHVIVYPMNNITKIWYKQKHDYAILYNWEGKNHEEQLEAIVLYLNKYIRYDTIQKYKDEYSISFYLKTLFLDKNYKESSKKFSSSNIKDYSSLRLFSISFEIKDSVIFINSDALYAVPNNSKYLNMIENPFNLDTCFRIGKKKKIWKEYN